MSGIGNEHGVLQRKSQESFLNAVRQLLSDNRIYGWCVRCRHAWRERRMGPVVSLLACIYKQLQGASARDVEDHLALLTQDSAESSRDGRDFCNARARLPIPVFQQAVKYTGATASSMAAQRYKNLKVCLADGTTMRAQRTEENQNAFGSSANQHGPSRNPLIRLVLLVCAGCGAVLDAAYSPYGVAEARLFTLLVKRLESGVLLVADTTACSFMNFAMSQMRGSHMLCPHRQDRKREIVKRLGKGETLELWRRPEPSKVAYPELLKGMPPCLEVRVITGIVHRHGYRDYALTLATTLLDPVQYPGHDLLELYCQRWNIELDIRTLKHQHGLDTLTAKNPQVACREMFSAILAYNCVRAIMAQSGKTPRRLSHHRAQRIILQVSMLMSYAHVVRLPALFQVLLATIRSASAPAQSRPPEPRAVLQRNRSFPYLKISRKAWRAQHRVA